VVACDAFCLLLVAAVVVCGEEARLHIAVNQAACRTAQQTACMLISNLYSIGPRPTIKL
jgi:hypothetical protein